MEQIEKIASGKNFDAASVGRFEELGDYTLELGPGIKIPGKVFVGKAIETTGCELSLQTFLPGTETGFLHTHKNHEEVYIFLKGNGQFQVDEKIFPVTEGSIVKVSPSGRRYVRNNGDEPLVMLCVQYKVDTFTAKTLRTA